MSYKTFKEYLEKGGFKIVTSEEEYNTLKKTSKLSTKLEYQCSYGHISLNTISSFKNKKSKYKNNFEGFCTKCKIINKNNNNQIISSSDNEIDNVQDIIITSELPVPVLEQKLEIVTDIVPYDTLPTECSSNDSINQPIIIYTDIISKFKEKEPEFFNYYLSRRDYLYNQYQTIGKLLFKQQEYTWIIVKWLKENKNIFTKSYFTDTDLVIDHNIYVPSLNLNVYIQPTVTYNIYPEVFLNKYIDQCKTNPVKVFIVNNLEIIDVWYFIPGKKVYSVNYKHNFNPMEKIVCNQSYDDIEYFYFEKTLSEFDFIN